MTDYSKVAAQAGSKPARRARQKLPGARPAFVAHPVPSVGPKNTPRSI